MISFICTRRFSQDQFGWPINFWLVGPYIPLTVSLDFPLFLPHYYLSWPQSLTLLGLAFLQPFGKTQCTPQCDVPSFHETHNGHLSTDDIKHHFLKFLIIPTCHTVFL